MKKGIKNIFPVVSVLIFLLFSQFSYISAFSSETECLAEHPGDPGCGDYGNYSTDTGDIGRFLNNVINLLIVIGSFLGVLFLVIAGYYFISARGDSRKIEKAKAMVLWVLIGVAIVVLARAMVEFVGKLKY